MGTWVGIMPPSCFLIAGWCFAPTRVPEPAGQGWWRCPLTGALQSLDPEAMQCHLHSEDQKVSGHSRVEREGSGTCHSLKPQDSRDGDELERSSNSPSHPPRSTW